MPYSLDDKLVVGISSRALFDMSMAYAVFASDGLEAYRDYQRAHEAEPLPPGTGFPLVQALLEINRRLQGPERAVEVVVISRNDADSAMRIFNSIEAYDLPITRGAFTNGGQPWRYVRPFRCSLFLSADPSDVVSVLQNGHPAALLLQLPTDRQAPEGSGPVRIAFDGDAVLFGDEALRVYQRESLAAFNDHERQRADVPLGPGPFRPFLAALARAQARFPPDSSPFRLSLVTARDAPAHRRVMTTLRHWNVRVDETFFLGGVSKTEILEVLAPHIYFDDQLSHLEGIALKVPSGHVIPVSTDAETEAPALPVAVVDAAPPTVAQQRPQSAD